MTDTIERDIAEQIAAAGFRLRFDKVALRLLDRVTADVASLLPPDRSVVFTVTAPIRLPGKTIAALQLLLADMPGGEVGVSVHGNGVRARQVDGVSPAMPRAIGFVHRPDSDAGAILDLAEATLRGQGPCG